MRSIEKHQHSETRGRHTTLTSERENLAGAGNILPSLPIEINVYMVSRKAPIPYRMPSGDGARPNLILLSRDICVKRHRPRDAVLKSLIPPSRLSAINLTTAAEGPSELSSRRNAMVGRYRFGLDCIAR